MKKKYSIALACLVLVVISGAYVYNQITRKKESLEAVEADMKLSADALIQSFGNDEKKAAKDYYSKIIEVTGTLKDIENNQVPETFVMGDSSSSTSIRFTLDSSVHFTNITFHKGDKIVIKGVCTGYNADELGLGADILFNRSIILNSTKN